MIDENSTRTELVKYFNEMIQENNDHLKELYGIINELKEELIRERECVDCLVIEEQKVMDGKSFEGEVLISCAEKARETQKQREIKL